MRLVITTDEDSYNINLGQLPALAPGETMNKGYQLETVDLLSDDSIDEKERTVQMVSLSPIA